MIKIYIKSLKKNLLINKRKLKSIALKVLELESILPTKDCEVGVTLVGDGYIRKLNKKYRKVNSPTDVLAFPIEVGEDKFLGDVYISLDRAAQQVQQNENIEIEVYRLLIHGLLHLLGYEHSEQMFIKQEQYLNASYKS